MICQLLECGFLLCCELPRKWCQLMSLRKSSALIAAERPSCCHAGAGRGGSGGLATVSTFLCLSTFPEVNRSLLIPGCSSQHFLANAISEVGRLPITGN